MSNISGPTYPVPAGYYLLEVPVADNVTEIGRPTKRYAKADIVLMKSSNLQGDTTGPFPVDSITTAGTCVLKSGDSMTGTLDMTGNNITDVNILQSTSANNNSIDLSAPGNITLNCGTSGTGYGALYVNGTIQPVQAVNQNSQPLANCGPIYPSEDNYYDLGQSGGAWQNLWVGSNLNGETTSRAVDSIVSVSSAPVVVGNVASFQSTTGITIQDTNIASSSLSRGAFSMAPTPGPSLSNSTALTSLLGTVVGSTTIPANSFIAGSVVRFSSSLTVSALIAHTLTLQLTLDGTTLWTYTLTPGAVTNALVVVAVDILSSNGSTVLCEGSITQAGSAPVMVSSTGTWSSTSSHVLDFKGEWSNASASDTVQANNAICTRVF